MCGGFGLGATREQDLEALRRFREHLEPGGLPAFDVEVPYSDERQWSYWLREGRGMPQPWWEGERRVGSDGTEYEVRSRTVAFDPLEARITRLVLMLERAGFVDVEVRGEYDDVEPTADDHFLVLLGRRART